VRRTISAGSRHQHFIITIADTAGKYHGELVRIHDLERGSCGRSLHLSMQSVSDFLDLTGRAISPDKVNRG